MHCVIYVPFVVEVLSLTVWLPRNSEVIMEVILEISTQIGQSAKRVDISWDALFLSFTELLGSLLPFDKSV